MTGENELSLKSLKSKIISAVIVAIVLGLGGIVWAKVQSIPEKIVVENGIRETLDRYAADINANSFDANNYFASHVEQFWDMTDQSPRLLNNWWAKNFPKLFSNMHISFDYSTLEVTPGTDCHTAHVTMYSDYFNNSTQQQVTHEASRYDLRTDDEYMIVWLKQKVNK